MFVSLEGIDGSGKSTQAKLLAKELGPDTVLLREPGGTPAAEELRKLLADPDLELDPRAELLLFCAARADLVEAVIRPALVSLRDVVTDRFVDSSVAYQGVARGLGVELVEGLNKAATGGLAPDLTLLLRVDPEATAGRLGAKADRFEAEGLDFQQAVAAAYEEIAAREPERMVTIDGGGSVDEVHARVMEAVSAKR